MKELEGLSVMNGIEQAGGWLARNHDLLVQYAVNIVAAVLILVLGSLVARIASRALRRVTQLRGIDPTVGGFLAALVRYAILAFVLMAALSRLGVQTASVIAVLGAAGLAVGLALQGSLSNFAAGVLLVIFRPLRAGEYVDLGGVAGTIDQVQLFSTTMRTPDNKTIVVPNSKIIAGNIINYSREPVRRVDITVNVPPSADIDVVKRALNEVIAADARILGDRDRIVRLNEMGPASLGFVVRVWTTTAAYGEVYFDLLEGFKRAIDANGLGFPRPQMDVHLHQ